MSALHKAIKKLVRDMQETKGIYTLYFESSNSVLLNQDANIGDFDKFTSVNN
jgi:hypothetical protein